NKDRDRPAATDGTLHPVESDRRRRDEDHRRRDQLHHRRTQNAPRTRSPEYQPTAVTELNLVPARGPDPRVKPGLPASFAAIARLIEDTLLWGFEAMRYKNVGRSLEKHGADSRDPLRSARSALHELARFRVDVVRCLRGGRR